jgi:hypothetical protein
MDSCKKIGRLSERPANELANLVKKRKVSFRDIPFKRQAQVRAVLRKEKVEPNLATEKVKSLKKLIKDRKKKTGEIPLQKRLQVLRAMEIEEALHQYYEENPD